MLIVLAVGLHVWIAPLLQGSWDLWAQSLVRLGSLALLGAWLSWRSLAGTVPLPPRDLSRWTALLALWATVVTRWSPLGALVLPEALNVLEAAGVLLAATLLSPAERQRVEQGVRLTAWVVWSLAFYQRFFLGEPAPASSLVNPNVYAGWLLMVLPLCWRWGDWALAVASLWALTWTGSAAAWTSLAVCMTLLGFKRSPHLFWAGILMGTACAVLLFSKAQTNAFSDRELWWEAALSMAAARPVLGFGPGAFAYLLPAWRSGLPAGLASLYAHQVPLELVVGWGIPGAMLLLCPPLRALWVGRGAGRFAVLAACLHSLVDYALLIPANLWLFAWVLGAEEPTSEGRLGVPFSRKPLLALAACLAAGWAASASFDLWQSDRLAAQAQEAVASLGDFQKARALLEEARARSPRSPHPPLLLARLSEALFARTRDRRFLVDAVRWQEAGCRANPYRPASWRDLARIRTALGDRPGAEAALEEGRRTVPHLR